MAHIRCPTWAICPLALRDAVAFGRDLGSLTRIERPLGTRGDSIRRRIWVKNRLRLITSSVGPGAAQNSLSPIFE